MLMVQGTLLWVRGTLLCVRGAPMQRHASGTRDAVMGVGYGVEGTGCVAAGACQWYKVCCAMFWVHLKYGILSGALDFFHCQLDRNQHADFPV